MKNSLLRFLLFVLGLLLSLILLAAVAFSLVNHTNGTLVSSGEKRSYLLYVPESYDPSTPAPLVITMHGFAEWPARQMHISRWNDLADEYGFIVVYPSGTSFPLRWRLWGQPGTRLDPMRDVRFISDLIDKIETDYNIDPARIYVNGFSNGGGMSFLLSCALSERIAAIGLVSGAFLTPWENCQPSRPVPAIVFHGTADPIVPFLGESFGRFGVSLPSIAEWVETLAQRNGCGGAPLELNPVGQVRGTRFADCAADLIFYAIDGGGHAWPGGEYSRDWIVRHTTRDIEATRTIWEFFQEHPLGE